MNFKKDKTETPRESLIFTTLKMLINSKTEPPTYVNSIFFRGGGVYVFNEDITFYLSMC